MKKFSVLTLPRNLTSEEIVNALITISKSNQYFTLVGNNKSLISEVVLELKRKPTDSYNLINKWLKQEAMSPPMELLWILEKQNLMKFTTYLYFHQNYVSTIQCCISNAISGDLEVSEEVLIKQILTDMLGTILAIKSSTDFKFLSEDIIQSTATEAASHVDSNSLIHWNYFSDLKKLKNIDWSALKEFALFHITKFLTYEGSEFDIPFVLSNHTKLWTSAKLSDELKSFILELISVLDPQTVLNEINTVVQQETLHWKYLLFMISVFVQDQKNSELMKGAVDNWLKIALDEKKRTLLFTLIIVARHCCAEKARYFTNYPTWFSSLPLKSVTNFTFFFQSLSQLVPNEPPLFLKIHVNKVPSAPSSCQSEIVDYVNLAKTRLSDLKETTDYIGLFNDYHDTDEEGQEADVQHAIALFRENNEIPKPLLEASVFRRQYYEKVFLKRLLSVGEADDPSRAKLIKKLHSTGKIPSAIYRSWSSLSLSYK